MGLLTPEFRADGTVREWHATAGGVETRVNDGYAPSIYVAAPEPVRADLAAALAADPKVVGTATERRKLALGADEPDPVLRVDLARVDEGRTLAHEIMSHHAADYAPGRVRLYDVDLAPGFRYCVDTDTEPVPARELRRLELSIPERALVEGDLTALEVDGERLVAPGDAGRAAAESAADPRRAAERAVLQALGDRLDAVDPDVLVVSTAELIPRCHERAAELGLDDFQLGRAPGYERLAGASTYESYGQVGHSPARYALPGRVVVDRSNSFLLSKTGLPGLLDLVERSWRPLQETARASIGTALTSIEIREARDRGVLAPWNKWEPETFKPVRTLHDADRGGFTFAPEPGIYEDVVEVDFASLYPNIMVEYNVSPETVDCDCCEGSDVPGLGYTICEDEGFLADVLGDLVDDRARFKDELAELRERADDDALAAVSGDYQAAHAEPAGDSPVAERVAALEGRIDALKWVLVSCFGYQGYRNAKFGRIECHEAINAYAREILLDAKERLEAGGWRVVHGIVDSLWVQREADRREASERASGEAASRGSDPEPIEDVAADVSARADIPLEVEARFDWVAFVPMRDSGAGALTKYFGRETRPQGAARDCERGERGAKRLESASGGAASEGRPTGREADQREASEKASGDEGTASREIAGADPGTDDAFTVRGIETRQRSTPEFVADAQRELIRILDRTRDPEAVCDRLARAIGRLERGAVDPGDLLITQRVSKAVEQYSQRTRAVAALERAADLGLERPPGTSVEYVVVADDRDDPERVRLSCESPSDYDADFYRERLVRAAESVVAPLGWDRARVRDYLRDGRDLSLSAFD